MHLKVTSWNCMDPSLSILQAGNKRLPEGSKTRTNACAEASQGIIAVQGERSTRRWRTAPPWLCSSPRSSDGTCCSEPRWSPEVRLHVLFPCRFVQEIPVLLSLFGIRFRERSVSFNSSYLVSVPGSLFWWWIFENVVDGCGDAHSSTW